MITLRLRSMRWQWILLMAAGIWIVCFARVGGAGDRRLTSRQVLPTHVGGLSPRASVGPKYNLALEEVGLTPTEEVTLAINTLAECLMNGGERSLTGVFSEGFRFDALDVYGDHYHAIRQLGEMIESWRGDVYVDINKVIDITDSKTAVADCTIEVTTSGWAGYDLISMRHGVITLSREGGGWRVSESGVLRDILHDITTFRAGSQE